MEVGAVGQSENKMGTRQANVQLEREVKQFAQKLKKEFALEVSKDPGSFRGRVIGSEVQILSPRPS